MQAQSTYAHRRGSIRGVANPTRLSLGTLPGWFGVVCLAVLSGFASLPAAAAGASPANPAFAAGHVLVAKYPASVEADFDAALGAQQGKSLGKLKGLDVHVVSVPAGTEQAAVGQLARNPHVRFAEVDALVEPSATVSDPGFSSEWHLTKISAPAAWDNSVGSGITIAILDTGVDGTHPDLAGLRAGWNFYDNNSNTSDVYGHGTAVAGTAAAAMDNGIGVAGVAGKANIMPVRISDPSGYASWSTVAQGLTWAADHGARVANISYSVAGSRTVISAANYFRSKGGVVALSAGNTGALDSASPTTSMLVVSATDASDAFASLSSYGSLVRSRRRAQASTRRQMAAAIVTLPAPPFRARSLPGPRLWFCRDGRTTRQPRSTQFSNRRPRTWVLPVRYLLRRGAGECLRCRPEAVTSGTGDSSPPTVAIASPTGGRVSGTVTVSINASDNVGVTRVELRVNGVTVATDTVTPFQFAWSSASIADGAVQLQAAAYDAAGNSAVSTAVSVDDRERTATGDTTPPTVAIASPSASTSSLSGTISVRSTQATTSP